MTAPISPRPRRRAAHRGLGRLAPALGLAAGLCLVASAQAQTSLSAAVDSDDRFRGFSLSGERPTLSINLNYDDASGVYAGLSGLAVATARMGPQWLGSVAYVGYSARRDGGRFALDVGLSNTNVNNYSFGRHAYDYMEVYGGVITDHLAAHAYVSPNYDGQAERTLYTDLDAAFRPAPQWRLFGHVGALTPITPRLDGIKTREQYDLRAGVSTQYKHCELHLAWSLAGPAPAYADWRGRSRSALVLGAAYDF